MKKIMFFVLAVIIITASIAVFFLFQYIGAPNTPGQPIVFPTKSPNAEANKVTSPKQTTYNKAGTQKLIDLAKNRQALSASGTAAKEAILQRLNNKSGMVYSSPTLIIDYVAAPDLFQGEILSTDVAGIKNEAVNWLLTQGFTKNDVCRLPFSFYLGPNIKAARFNPLPNGC